MASVTRPPVEATPGGIESQLGKLYRSDFRKVVAPLIRILGSFEAAEDVAQEAFAQALVAWPRDGIPDKPVAWLFRVAKNRAIDLNRRGQVRDRKEKELAAELGTYSEDDLSETALRDDSLRLIFTCCHPSLSVDARVALTLHTVCGLSSKQVARAFLVKRETLQQRLVRAKRKIDRAKIPYLVPDHDQLPARLESVLRTVYLVFNEGYGATEGESLLRSELCEEALRLGRMLVALLPASPSAKGLLALMLLQHSRRHARTSSEGNLVTLEQQDRLLWDQDMIEEALPLVDQALKGRPLSTFAVESSIAALHAQAATPEETDWLQIAALYRTLVPLSGGNPVIMLNSAVAIAMAGNLEAGLRQLEELEKDGHLKKYHLLDAAKGELLRRAGHYNSAKHALQRAIQHANNPVERRFLKKRLQELESP